MSHTTFYLGPDADDFWVIECSCGFKVEGLPDMETAADVFGDHCYVEGHAEGLNMGRRGG